MYNNKKYITLNVIMANGKEKKINEWNYKSNSTARI